MLNYSGYSTSNFSGLALDVVHLSLLQRERGCHAELMYLHGSMKPLV